MNGRNYFKNLLSNGRQTRDSNTETFGCVKMSDFVPNNRHLREVLIFFLHSKKTAAEAHRELHKVYGDAALSEVTCRDSLHRFKDGDFDVDDRPLASALGVTRQAISKRLHALGMI